MAATAKAAPDLKRLAGGARGGRKLAKPVLHYSLSWAQDETPDKREMSRAVDGSLEALGLEGHEALIVAHEDTRHPHVHVIANRVDPETGKAATLGNSKLRLSRWAEGYEREHGRIRCERRVENHERRRACQEMVRGPSDRPSHWARVRREGMQPGRARRARKPRREDQVDMEAWRHGGMARRRLGRRSRPGARISLGITGTNGPRWTRQHGERAREIEHGVRKLYRMDLVDAERRAWAVRERMRERQETRERERGPSIIIPIPHSPAPRPRAWRGRVRAVIPEASPSPRFKRDRLAVLGVDAHF